MIRSASDNLSEKFNKLRVVANIRGIRNRDFSIIASNCTGTLPYRFLNIPYTSPTVNLFFHAPCYLKLVKNLDYYLSVPLRFTPRSSYAQGELVRSLHHHYPVGRLDDIEVHFMHYSSETEAADKWNRRKERINRDNMIFAFTDKDLCTDELISEFDALPFDNKYVLTAKAMPHIKSAIHVPACDGMTEIGDCYTRYDHLSHIDFRQLIDRSSAAVQHDTALYASR